MAKTNIPKIKITKVNNNSSDKKIKFKKENKPPKKPKIFNWNVIDKYED